MAGKVCTVAVLTLHLDVDVGHVVHGEGLALGSVKHALSLMERLVHAFLVCDVFGLIGVHASQELVVFRVRCELNRVLIVGEESVVTVGKISQGAALLSKRREKCKG